MTKGKNGQQIAQENIKLVQTWIGERNAARDWHEKELKNNQVWRQ
ncbi:hypothetical protein [Photobacterium damselae]|nr:hypothetical protein [Photobacterium damselae]